MTKCYSVSLIIGCVLSFVGACKSADIETLKSETVLIQNAGFFGAGLGSGVLLDEKHVLTCAHMVDRKTDTLLIFTYPMKDVIIAHVEIASKEDDLAILVLDSSATVKHTPSFETQVTDGEPITIIGNALGSMHWFISEGLVSGNEAGNILTDGSVYHGDSGGPWFNSKGDIVALSDWGLENKDHLPYGVSGGVSSATILAFFEEIKQRNSMSMLLQMLGTN